MEIYMHGIILIWMKIMQEEMIQKTKRYQK